MSNGPRHQKETGNQCYMIDGICMQQTGFEGHSQLIVFVNKLDIFFLVRAEKLYSFHNWLDKCSNAN